MEKQLEIIMTYSNIYCTTQLQEEIQLPPVPLDGWPSHNLNTWLVRMEAFQRFPTSLSPSRSWAWDLQFVEMRSANPAEKSLEIYAIAAIPDLEGISCLCHTSWPDMMIWGGGMDRCLDSNFNLKWLSFPKKSTKKWSPSWMQYFEAK